MTPHDRIRRDRAIAHQNTNFSSVAEELESLRDAIRGLQSTDDPSLVPLHDELMERQRVLESATEMPPKKESEPQGAPVELVYVEICRSFSWKHNCGNYESRDFFCSQKRECLLEDAQKVSQELYEFCKSEVMRAVAEYVEETAPKKAKR